MTNRQTGVTEAVLTRKGGTGYYTEIAGWLDRHTLLLFAKDHLLAGACPASCSTQASIVPADGRALAWRATRFAAGPVRRPPELSMEALASLL